VCSGRVRGRCEFWMIGLMLRFPFGGKFCRWLSRMCHMSWGQGRCPWRLPALLVPGRDGWSGWNITSILLTEAVRGAFLILNPEFLNGGANDVGEVCLQSHLPRAVKAPSAHLPRIQ